VVTPPPVAPSSATFDESLLTGKEFLLSAPSKGLSPAAQDRELGPLADNEPVVLAAKHFFEALHNHGDLAKLCDPPWLDYVKDATRQWALQGWIDAKVFGMPLVDAQGSWTVPFRGKGTQGNFEGWLVFLKKDQAWLVTDLEAHRLKDWDGPYNPESPDQEISSPNRR